MDFNFEKLNVKKKRSRKGEIKVEERNEGKRKGIVLDQVTKIKATYNT